MYAWTVGPSITSPDTRLVPPLGHRLSSVRSGSSVAHAAAPRGRPDRRRRPWSRPLDGPPVPPRSRAPRRPWPRPFPPRPRREVHVGGLGVRSAPGGASRTSNRPDRGRSGPATGPKRPSERGSGPPAGATSWGRTEPGRRGTLRSPHAPRPDRPRPGRPVVDRLHAPARAHPDRPVAHRGPLGLLGAHEGRAGDARGAGALPGGRRDDPGRPHPRRRRPRPALAQAAGRAERPPPRDGRRLVPHGVLPGRDPDRQALGGLARRGARPRGDGRRRRHRRADRDPGRDRHRQAVGDPVRGARLPRRRPRLATDRASPSRPTRS